MITVIEYINASFSEFNGKYTIAHSKDDGVILESVCAPEQKIKIMACSLGMSLEELGQYINTISKLLVNRHNNQEISIVYRDVKLSMYTETIWNHTTPSQVLFNFFHDCEDP